MAKEISELTEVLLVDINNNYVVVQHGIDNKKLKVANMMVSTNNKTGVSTPYYTEN